VAIFDFIERTIAARGVAKCGDVSDLKLLEAVSSQSGGECRGRFFQIGSAVRQRTNSRTKRGVSGGVSQPAPTFHRRVFKRAGQELVEERAGDGLVNGGLQSRSLCSSRREEALIFFVGVERDNAIRICTGIVPEHRASWLVAVRSPVWPPHVVRWSLHVCLAGYAPALRR